MLGYRDTVADFRESNMKDHLCPLLSVPPLFQVKAFRGGRGKTRPLGGGENHMRAAYRIREEIFA